MEAICSAVFDCPKMTSGNPVLSLRSKSTVAKTCPLFSLSSPGLSSAKVSSKERSPEEKACSRDTSLFESNLGLLETVKKGWSAGLFSLLRRLGHFKTFHSGQKHTIVEMK